MIHPDEAEISVIPDGTAWICEVRWPDGQSMTRMLRFTLAGFPEIVVTTEERALECLETSVRNKPSRWRRAL